MLFRENLFFKIVLFLIIRKLKNLRISWGILNQNVIFCVQKISQKLILKKKFFLKILLLKNISFLKIMHHEIKKTIFLQNLTRCKSLNQDLTGCIFFNSKSDALKLSQFKL